MAILGMPWTTINKAVNSAKTMEEELMSSNKYFNKAQDELESKKFDYDFNEEPWKTRKKKTKANSYISMGHLLSKLL